MKRPLEDISVVEVGSWMASPSAGAILADMGADVIKVEPLSGDPMRNMCRRAKIGAEIKGYDFGFDVDNRGKRSIALALDDERGASLVRRLAGAADVFLCNLLPHRQERFGLEAKRLLGENPRVVHATLTGYGGEGPDAWRPGYDMTAFFARSGISDAMREGDEGVAPMFPPAQGDHTTGLALVGAILAALRLAERTGKGQVVETSLYETAVWTLATDLAVTAVDKAPVRRRARHQMIVPTVNRYPCGDGKWLMLNVPGESDWPSFCRVIGREDWLEDERLRTARGRYRNMPEIVQGIDTALSQKSRDEWGEVFDANGIIWGPVLALDEVVEDPQAQALGLFPEVVSEQIGAYRTVRNPMRFDTAEVGPRGPAPALGQHSREILREAGFSHDEIDKLIQDRVVR